MWDRQFSGKLESNDVTAENSQAFVFSVFVSGFEQELQPQANAQEVLSGFNGLEDRLYQPAMLQLCDGITKCSDAGKNDLAGGRDDVRRIRDDGFRTAAFDRLLHAAKIAHPVIYNRNHRPTFFESPTLLSGASAALAPL